VMPATYWEWTGERLNVQDYIDGIAGGDYAAVEQAGLDRHRIAQRGTRAILEMILEHGFFHADPHPGNIKYLPDEQIGLLDFGMVGRLSDDRRHEVAELLARPGQARCRTRSRVSCLTGVPDSDADSDRLEEDIAPVDRLYHGVPLEKLDMSAMIGDMTAVCAAIT
jgi:ubiquinone biosynthesis protein